MEFMGEKTAEPSASGTPPVAENTVTGDAVPPEHLLGQFIPLHYHYNMLQDADRVDAFKDAIDHVVRPGMKVLELGGGTGILSSFAARAGANVYCVERNPELVASARRFLRDNGLANQVEVIQADAETYLPPEPVDAVICEMLHVALLREKQLEVIDSFKQRYSEKFDVGLPKFLPEASVLTFQAVQQSFDFAGYRAPVPLFQAPIAEQPRTKELSELITYAQFCYDESIPHQFSWQGQLDVQQPGWVTALRFITQNLITIIPEEGRGIPWPNQFLVLPIAEPISVTAGSQLDIEFAYRGGEPLGSLAHSIRVTPSAGDSELRRDCLMSSASVAVRSGRTGLFVRPHGSRLLGPDPRGSSHHSGLRPAVAAAHQSDSGEHLESLPPAPTMEPLIEGGPLERLSRGKMPRPGTSWGQSKPGLPCPPWLHRLCEDHEVPRVPPDRRPTAT